MLKVKRKWVSKCSRRSLSGEKDRKEKDDLVITPPLNSDIMRNIFTRLQPDFLYDNFKHQCKEWLDILSVPNFNDGIFIHSKPGILFRTHKFNRMMIGFIEFYGLDLKVRELSTFDTELKIISCDNGLVLVRKEYEDSTSVYILNPITKESIEIPPCEHNCLSHDLVFVPSTKKYMLVDMFYRNSTGYPTFHIRSIGGGFWNDSYCSSDILKDVRVVSSYTDMFADSYWNERISIDGILFVNRGGIRKIVALDMQNEEVKLLKVPVSGEEWVKIIELDGSLSVVNAVKFSEKILLDIWILKDINTGEWEQIMRIDDLPNRFSDMWFQVVGNGQTLVFVDENDILAHDVKTRQWKLTTVNGGSFFEHFHSPHVNTLASIR